MQILVRKAARDLAQKRIQKLPRGIECGVNDTCLAAKVAAGSTVWAGHKYVWYRQAPGRGVPRDIGFQDLIQPVCVRTHAVMRGIEPLVNYSLLYSILDLCA